MSTPIQKLKRLQALKQGRLPGAHSAEGPVPDGSSDKIVIVMNKWNVFFILLFQVILGFLFFGLGFLFCLKTSEALVQKKAEARKPAYGKLYIPSSSSNAQDRSIVQSMEDYDRR